eukprot:CAMPEP_0172408740 /NCGR_PEP_ID=MMETSP1061-20121228/76009_1 /TAXON_ID=37318 /ORGANISM="Pseudo-nitzschia pungens, Strain cf. pungens" /LENGTH=737 /DNA_ID=CAMNT_0013144883 /DNA_START=42 /DNA_END=2254 /DNA_ORIENTATION=+
MNSVAIFSSLDSVLLCNVDKSDTTGNDAVETLDDRPIEPPEQQHRQSVGYEYEYDYEYEHERFLVAWVLLTRMSQEYLDRAWEKHGAALSKFASCLLAGSDEDDDDEDEDDEGNLLLDVCYIRLMGQVTARLTTSPSQSLKQSISAAWKRALSSVSKLQRASSQQSATTTASSSKTSSSSTTTTTTTTTTSSSNSLLVALNVDVCNAVIAWIEQQQQQQQQASSNSLLVALNVDVCNAVIAWIEQEDGVASSQIALSDVWNAYTVAHATASQSLESSKEIKDNPKSGVQRSDRGAMISVLESVLGPTENESNADETNANEDFYTIENLERLVIAIFELEDTNNYTAPEELVGGLLQWIAKRDLGERFTPELRILWHGWLMKNVKKCLSQQEKKKKSHSALLRNSKAMDVMQTILLAHAVSPEERALRPMAWQCMAQIVRTYGWSWGTATSKSAPICTWCRLANGEWKIQLEEEGDPTSDKTIRTSILDGCGRVMIGVVQYLVDFEERPDKRMPLDPDGLVHVRESLEETLFTTSTYLNRSPIVSDDTNHSLIINLWSQLCSEVDLSTVRRVDNVILCLKKLLLASDDESLLQPLVHVIGTAQIEPKVLRLVGEFDGGFVDPVVVYLDRFWKKATDAKYTARHPWHDQIHWACVAVEMLAEHKLQTISRLADPMLQAIASLVPYLQTASRKEKSNELLSILQLLVDSYVSAFENCRGTTSTDKESLILSSAIGILEKQ